MHYKTWYSCFTIQIPLFEVPALLCCFDKYRCFTCIRCLSSLFFAFLFETWFGTRGSYRIESEVATYLKACNDTIEYNQWLFLDNLFILVGIQGNFEQNCYVLSRDYSVRNSKMQMMNPTAFFWVYFEFFSIMCYLFL